MAGDQYDVFARFSSDFIADSTLAVGGTAGHEDDHALEILGSGIGAGAGPGRFSCRGRGGAEGLSRGTLVVGGHFIERRLGVGEGGGVEVAGGVVFQQALHDGLISTQGVFFHVCRRRRFSGEQREGYRPGVMEISGFPRSQDFQIVEDFCVVRGELGMCEKFCEVARDEAVLEEEKEHEEAETIGREHVGFVKHADDLIGEAFWLFVFFVEARREDLIELCQQMECVMEECRCHITCSTLARSGNLFF